VEVNVEPIFLLIIFFGGLLVLLAIGFPVAFSLASLATVFSYWLWGGTAGFFTIISTDYGKLTEFIIIAIPLFIFMAGTLQHTGIADDLYELIYRFMGALRGGLGMGTIIICAIFAAMAGISTVATAAMGLIALPSMLERKYDKNLAIGSVCAGGALGILIPPSIIMILYGVEAGVSIGKLFIGGIIPGILLAILFILYIGIRSWLQPELAPGSSIKFTSKEKIVAMRNVILPFLLITLVLGVIYTGVCTPTEAAGIGAFGALLCALMKGKLNWPNLKETFQMTVRINAMVCWIMISAGAFSKMVAVSGLGDWICESVGAVPVSRWVILAFIQFIFLILGMFLDPAGIILITTPIFVPIIMNLGFDPLWFGILFIINMEMAYITPPFGFNLFIMRGVVPPEISMGDIYRSIIPFVGIQALCLLLIILFPGLATWLPAQMVK